MKRWWILVVVLMIASCSSSSPTGQVADEVPQMKVSITKHSYDPIVLFTEPGTEVVWTNNDDSPHTITILGKFDSGVLGRRHTFKHRFDQEGTYSYTDLLDQDREGKVVVK